MVEINKTFLLNLLKVLLSVGKATNLVLSFFEDWSMALGGKTGSPVEKEGLNTLGLLL